MVRQIPLAQEEYSWLGGVCASWASDVESHVSGICENILCIVWSPNCMKYFLPALLRSHTFLHAQNTHLYTEMNRQCRSHCHIVVVWFSISGFSINRSHKSMHFLGRPQQNRTSHIPPQQSATHSVTPWHLVQLAVDIAGLFSIIEQQRKAGKINTHLPTLKMTPGFCVFLLLHNGTEILWVMAIQQQHISSNHFSKL